MGAELRQQHGVEAEILVADLAAPAAPADLVAELTRRGLAIDVLVNNAGYGVPGRFEQVAWETHDAFLQVLVTAVCELSYRLLPGMIERRWGRIVNVASLAGHVPAPAGHTLYAASKAFLIRFSEALHAEHARDGVFTTAVCPGFTYSEFHDVTGTRAKVSQMPKLLWMDAATVAEQGYAAVMRGDPVYINGRVNRTIALAARILPVAVMRSLVGRSGRRFRAVD
jgi:short-subunit dehydrogenase